MFFTQHPAEKRSASLWEGVFFIAPKALFAKVMAATEGGIPMSRYPVGRIALGSDPSLGIQSWVAHWVVNVFPASGEQGEVPSVPVALGGYGTLSRETMFGGSR